MAQAGAPSWKFRCYVNARGEDIIDNWLERVSVVGKANLDRTLEHLRVQPKDRWSRPHASPLGDHVYVIRFKDQNRTQHRLFGYFDDQHSAFVISVPGIERDDVYEPANPFRIVDSRRSD